MEFSSLANLHAGQTCWICGTGPSLDDLDDAAVHGPRILINRAAFTVPAAAGQTYWLVLDDAWRLGVSGPWAAVLGAVMSGAAGMVGVFRNPMLCRGQLTHPPRGEHIATFGAGFGRGNREQILELGREEVGVIGQLYERIGSAATAMHLAWYLGCERVVLAGIDGGKAGGVARRVAHWYEPMAATGDYETARRWMLVAAERLGMSVSYVQRRAA